VPAATDGAAVTEIVSATETVAAKDTVVAAVAAVAIAGKRCYLKKTGADFRACFFVITLKI